MRNKKAFSFDEERDAENIIANGFKYNTIDYSQMYTIAKYFKDKFGYGEIRLERELVKFCKSHDKNFNPVAESESIKRWIRSAMTYSLRKIESVQISKKEIEFLRRIETTRDRKLLFMTLVLAKALKFRNTRRDKKETTLSNNYYIHYNNLLDIIRLSGLKNITETNLASILHKYKNHLTLYSPERELIKINFVDAEMEKGIEIDDMDNLLGYYDKFFVEKEEISNEPFKCKRCEKETTKIKNNQKYCPSCALEVKKEIKRKWWSENRSKAD